MRKLLRHICSDMNVGILSGDVAKDHVHVFVSIPPQVSVNKVIQKLKGKSSHKLQRELKSLHKEYWGSGRGHADILLAVLEI